MKRREMKLLLEERFERIALLETRIDTMDQLVEGYRAREQSVLDALQAAKLTAGKALEQAQGEGAQVIAEAHKTLAEAEQTRINARAEAEALLSDAITAANTLKAEAERRAIEVTATVKADSERMLRDAEIIKREYEEMVDSFNAMLEQNASELEITAARFAEFVKNRKIDRAEARLDGNAFYKSVGELSDAALPDASGDPALLMQNIYRIQNRPLPEDRLDVTGAQDEQPQAKVEPVYAVAEPATQPAAEEKPLKAETEPVSAPVFPMEDGNGADERQSVTEPYSEAAWSNEAQQSQSEPQAEFTKSFDNAYAKSEYTIHDDECGVTQADVESEFDALMSNGAPLSSAAVAIPTAAVIASENLAVEPMADAARAFDAYFDETFEPSGKAAQDEIPAEQATEPEGTTPQPEPAPEYVSDAEAEEIINSFTNPSSMDHSMDGSIDGSTDATQTVTAPEPYSARAWEHESFTSELEPQAEGTLLGEQDVEPTLPAQTYSDYEKQPSSSSDAEKAFDDYLAGIGAFTAAPAASAKAEETAPKQAAVEPYSARAWEHESFTSELEPQAEGTLLGEQDVEPTLPAQTYSDYEKQPSSSNDAEKAFDDYLAGIGAFAAAPATSVKTEETTPKQAAVLEPYSARAWEHESFTSELEPQAEGTLLGEQDVEPTMPAQPASEYEKQPSTSSDAEKAFDDYLAGIGTFAAAPAASAKAEETAPKQAAVEPYSARAWEHESFTSELEPQAEGTLLGEQDAEPTLPAQTYSDYEKQPSTSNDAEKAFDDYLANINAVLAAQPATPAVDVSWSYEEPYRKPQTQAAPFAAPAEAEEEEEEPKPAPRRYNEYGEIREWEPEPEPEMGDIPTVSRYVGHSGGEDEVSLDDLLDEIIKAGD